MRFRILVVLAVLVPLGVATKFYAGPGHVWVRTHAGGALYVVFWSLLVLGFRPQLSPWVAGGSVLAVTSILEFSQLWHPPLLETVRSTFLGHALIGSTFAWSDFPHYVLGMLIAVCIAKLLRRPG